MTLTKDHIIRSIQKKLELPKNTSSDLFESALEEIKRSLSAGEDVLISGFGKFCVRSKGERKGRNPSTGNDLILGARKVVTFRCSPLLRDKVNGNKE